MEVFFPLEKPEEGAVKKDYAPLLQKITHWCPKKTREGRSAKRFISSPNRCRAVCDSHKLRVCGDTGKRCHVLDGNRREAKPRSHCSKHPNQGGNRHVQVREGARREFSRITLYTTRRGGESAAANLGATGFRRIPGCRLRVAGPHLCIHRRTRKGRRGRKTGGRSGSARVGGSPRGETMSVDLPKEGGWGLRPTLCLGHSIIADAGFVATRGEGTSKPKDAAAQSVGIGR